MDNQIYEVEVMEKRDISHDSIFLRLKSFKLFEKLDVSFFVYIYDEKCENKKPYTPITWSEEEFCFIIKIYQGKGVSEYINGKSVGDLISISQPIFKLKYNGNYNNILMICGGTGITPMLQILKHEDNLDKFTIVDCNKTYNDILINKSIINKKLNIFHLLSREKEDCGENEDFYYINKQNVMKTRFKKEILENIVKSKGIEMFDLVYICGPPGFMRDISGTKTPDFQQGEITGILGEMGYDTSNVYKF